MTASERAAQIWPILVLSASRRQTLTYDLLGRLTGVRAEGLPELLEPIQAYCLLEGLAPLTAIVVDRSTGLPGDGFIKASDVPRAQEDVYARDWLSDGPPRAETLQDASDGMLARRARAKQRRAAKAPKNRRSLTQRRRTDTP
jgi:hypothetical protein